jgi:hypothetical protein
MSKTIKIPYVGCYKTDNFDFGQTLTLDANQFKARVENPEHDLALAPAGWLYAGLIARCNDTKKFKLTPRGVDLLASIDSIPDDPEPEVKTKPCSKCHGSGEQPLFVSMETCDRCKGSKVEQSEARARLVGYSKLFINDKQVCGIDLASGFVHDEIQIRSPSEHEVIDAVAKIKKYMDADAKQWIPNTTKMLEPVLFNPMGHYRILR